MRKSMLIIAALLLLFFQTCKKEKEEIDSEKPSVTILYPAELSEFIEGVSVRIKADASDNVGIKKVVFLIDGVEVSSDNSKPYEYEWKTTGKVGSHTILIKAEDDAGNIGESSVISVKIEEAIENILAGYIYNILNNPIEGAKIYYELSLKSNPIPSNDLIEHNSHSKQKHENYETITGEWGEIFKNGNEFAGIEVVLSDQSSNSAHRNVSNKQIEKEDVGTRKSLLNTGNDPVITDPNGYFEIGDLETGSYTLQIISDNYLEYNTTYTVHEGVNEKNYVLASDILPHIYGLNLTDGDYLVDINWSDLNFSTLKGYNVYSQYFFLYNGDMEEDQYYYKPIYSDWIKINPTLLNTNQYTASTEEYNSKYGFYVLPENIDDEETEFHSTHTQRRYTDVHISNKPLIIFSLSGASDPIYIPDNSHEMALHMRYYYTHITYVNPTSWKVKISTDGSNWTTLATHGLPEGYVNKYYYGYTKTISMNSYKGLVVYFKTDPESFDIKNRSYIIQNKVIEYNMDGTGFLWYDLPTVETAELTNITENSALSGGNVTDDGNLTVTARGVCWSTNLEPTIDDFYSNNGTGMGAYVSQLTGLDKNTVYYVRAYAENTLGIVYGDEISFKTEIGDPCDGITSFIYQGQEYNIIAIGDQCWMSENLNVGTMINSSDDMQDNGVIEKYCCDNDPANCEIYGGLYQWNEMMQYTTQQGTQGICPSGWHIPTDDEYKILEGTVDSQYGVGDPEWDDFGLRGFDAGYHLKSTTGWYNNGNGDDSFGFTALPGGYRYGNVGCDGLSGYAYVWSSAETSGSDAWGRLLYYYNDGVGRGHGYKADGFSARCLQD